MHSPFPNQPLFTVYYEIRDSPHESLILILTTVNPQLTTHNPQPTTHNPQLTTHNP